MGCRVEGFSVGLIGLRVHIGALTSRIGLLGVGYGIFMTRNPKNFLNPPGSSSPPRP